MKILDISVLERLYKTFYRFSFMQENGKVFKMDLLPEEYETLKVFMREFEETNTFFVDDINPKNEVIR